jgi:hypothetical protein
VDQVTHLLHEQNASDLLILMQFADALSFFTHKEGEKERFSSSSEQSGLKVKAIVWNCHWGLGLSWCLNKANTFVDS